MNTSAHELAQSFVSMSQDGDRLYVSRDAARRRHDVLVAELQLLRQVLGMRPLPTRSHQRELERNQVPR